MNVAGLRQVDGERGATLLIVLFMVVVLGLGIGIAGSTWKSVTQRARETELFWRGDQYRKAIKSYYEVGLGKAPGQFPRSLDDLVKDSRFLQGGKHIRRLYEDPMTGEGWVLIKDKAGWIVGVRSGSDLEPFRKDGFPKEYEKFEGSDSYSSWEFIFEPAKKQIQSPEQKPAEQNAGGESS